MFSVSCIASWQVASVSGLKYKGSVCPEVVGRVDLTALYRSRLLCPFKVGVGAGLQGGSLVSFNSHGQQPSKSLRAWQMRAAGHT